MLKNFPFGSLYWSYWSIKCDRWRHLRNTRSCETMIKPLLRFRDKTPPVSGVDIRWLVGSSMRRKLLDFKNNTAKSALDCSPWLKVSKGLSKTSSDNPIRTEFPQELPVLDIRCDILQNRSGHICFVFYFIREVIKMNRKHWSFPSTHNPPSTALRKSSSLCHFYL